MQKYFVAAIIAAVGVVTAMLLPGKFNGASCSVSPTRPCYERQTGKKIIVLNPQGGENAFRACMESASGSKRGELAQKTSLCGEEVFQYCYEGQSQVVIRKFAGVCKTSPTSTPSLQPSPSATPTPTPTSTLSPMPPATPTPTPTPTPVSVPAITVLYPNGGELVVVDEKVKISWKANAISSKSVTIRLLKSGVPHATLVSSTPQSSESGTFSYVWSVPASIQDQTGFTIEVFDTANPAVKDVSDGPFRVSYPTPAAGFKEVWPPGLFQRQVGFYFSIVNYPGTVSLKVYEKRPGASAFSSLVTFPITTLPPCNARVSEAAGWLLFYTCGRSDPFEPYDQWSAWHQEKNLAAYWPAGTYEYYIAAVDASGKETIIPPSGIARATSKILKNFVKTPAAISSPIGATSPTPLFSWTGGGSISVYEDKPAGDMQQPYWTTNGVLQSGTTTFSKLYDGPVLDTAKRYYAFTMWGMNVRNQENLSLDVYDALLTSAPLFWVSATPSP